MRKALWSAAALVLSGSAVLMIGPTVQAADTVTMGSNTEPNAFKFFPKEITVPVGGTVVWRNLSDLQHDAKAEDGSFASPLLDKNKEFSFTFKTPGDVTFFCTVSGHRDAGMEGVIHVTGAAAPPPPAAPTTTTAAAAGGATTTTAKAAAGGATTTTAKAAAGGSTTTTTAGGGATSTTQAPSATPTSAPETGGVTPAAPSVEGGAVDEHASGESESKKEDDDKSSPVGIAFAAVSTVLLAAICGKLLGSKS
jgi:plastocyanin